jgi:hypothetical protein
MQLGRELATGFVSEETQATAAGEAVQPDGDGARVPEVSPPPAPEPEPTTAG